MPNVFKKIIFAALIFLMFVPLLQQVTGYFYESELKGAYVKPEKPRFSLSKITSLEFQQKTEEYQNFNFGFRSFLIRLRNSINYLFFKDIAVSDQIEGKNGFIYSVGSIERNITGSAYNGKEKNNSTILQLKNIVDILEKKNVSVVLVLAPSKESIMPENLPWQYINVKKNGSDYDDFLSYLNKYNIPFIDFNSHFKSIKSEFQYPLFTKTGFHWSVYGASLAHDSLVAYLQKMVSYSIPKYIRSGVQFSDTAQLSDADFEPQMNLFFSLQDDKYVYPKLEMDSSSLKNKKPKVVIIGDSFFYTIKNLNKLQYIFSDDSKYLYYFKKSFPLSDAAGSDMSDIDVMSEIESADVIMLVASLGTLGEFPYGFSDYYLNNQSSGGILDCIKGSIKNMPTRYQFTITKAEENNTSLDSFINNQSKTIYRNIQKIQLKAFNGKYVCADASKNNLLFANRNEAYGWETFSLINFDDGKSALYSNSNKFLCAELNSLKEITATRESIGNWESFKLIYINENVVAIKADNGKYVSIDNETFQLYATSDSIGEKEKFTIDYLPTNK